MFGGFFTAFDAMIAVRDAVRHIRAPAAARAAVDRELARDRARIDFQRLQHEDERRRADAALELDLRRKAVDHELARLRLLAGTALIGWIASIVVLGIRAGATSIPARVAIGAGWLLLLGAMATAFTAQARVIASEFDRGRPIESGAMALWLLIVGLGFSAVSLFL